jgi:hypothetical protein
MAVGAVAIIAWQIPWRCSAMITDSYMVPKVWNHHGMFQGLGHKLLIDEWYFNVFSR